MERNRITGIWTLILLAGLAGGAAEVLWIALYSGATGTSGAEVAREVTASVWPAAVQWPSAPALGIGIHMALSLALAAVLVPFLLRLVAPRPGRRTLPLGAVAALALALVWAGNFFLVLPALNPQFVTLMPSAVTLVSKLLFAAAMVHAMRLYSARTAHDRVARKLA